LTTALIKGASAGIGAAFAQEISAARQMNLFGGANRRQTSTTGSNTESIQDSRTFYSPRPQHPFAAAKAVFDAVTQKRD